MLVNNSCDVNEKFGTFFYIIDDSFGDFMADVLSVHLERQSMRRGCASQ